MAQGFIRKARKLDSAALDVFKTVVGILRGFRAAKACDTQLELLLMRHPVHHGRRDAQQGKLRVSGSSYFQRIKTENKAVFFQRCQSALVVLRYCLGKKLDKRIEIRLAGNIHSGLRGVFQQVLLQGGVDNMSVIAVAQQGFAYGYGVFERLMHPWLLANKITGNG